MGKVYVESLVENLSKRQLIELDACTRCGECIKWCPVYSVTSKTSFAPMDKITEFRSFIKARHGMKAKLLEPDPVDEDSMHEFAESLYRCTTCGTCGVVCPVGIHCQELWPAIRGQMVRLGFGPVGFQKLIAQIVREKHNPYDRPHAERRRWLPPEFKVQESAEIGYYAGCTGAYTAQPMIQGAVRMLQASGADFTLLDDEWCCGFPLFVVGELDLLKELTKHNVDDLASKGVRRLITSCPCCTNQIRFNWPKYYGGKLPFELVHVTQIISERIDEGKLSLSKRVDATVAYHDPCYLARGWGYGVGIVEEPRKILQAIPGLRLVEMERNRQLSKCCGAGGGIRRAFPETSFDMAISLIQDAEKTGADILLLDCPACYERLHLALEVRDYKTPLRILDLMEFTASLL